MEYLKIGNDVTEDVQNYHRNRFVKLAEQYKRYRETHKYTSERIHKKFILRMNNEMRLSLGLAPR